MRTARSLVFCVAVLTLANGFSRVSAYPFCPPGSFRPFRRPLTLSEQLAQSDAVVLVQWVKANRPPTADAGQKGAGTSASAPILSSTVYEILQVVKSPKGKGALKKGNRVTLNRFRAGKKGDLFLLTGTKGTNIEWGSPLEVTETSFNYIAQAPSPEAPTQKRLAYFLRFLEFPDQLVSDDAFTEFTNARCKDIASLAERFPRDQIRKWVVSSETSTTRLGLYWRLLGMCGTRQDAVLMEKQINEASEYFRPGIDGVMSGYLLLTGAKGLEFVDDATLKNKKTPFRETYAAMMMMKALRFMWICGDGRIEKERLRQSMRMLLDRPELADLVIADIARWKDWSVQDKMMSLYWANEYNIPSINRAILRYILVSTKDVTKDK